MFSGIKIYSTNTCLVSVYQLIFFPFVLFVGWGFGVAKLIWNCNVCFENLHNNSKKGNILDGFFSVSPKKPSINLNLNHGFFFVLSNICNCWLGKRRFEAIFFIRIILKFVFCFISFPNQPKKIFLF